MLALLFATAVTARSQQAVSSITQSRLFTNPQTPGTTSVDANGNIIPESAATSSGDSSFGTQIILKSQERPPSFNIFGDVSGFYTNNADLTPRRVRSDFFSFPTWEPPDVRRSRADLSVTYLPQVLSFDMTEPASWILKELLQARV